MDTVVLFSRGATEDKLRIIFDMCDDDRNGVIDKGELSEMLRSLVEIARTTSLRDEHVTELIDGMFSVSKKYIYFESSSNNIKVMLHNVNVLIILGCRSPTQRSLNIFRFQSNDEGIQRRICSYWLGLQGC